MATMTTAAFLALVNANLLMPPERYRHMPGPAYRVERTPAKYMDLMCLPNKPTRVGSVRTGCVVYTKKHGYVIYIDSRLHGEALARVLEHEDAHTKKWRH